VVIITQKKITMGLFSKFNFSNFRNLGMKGVNSDPAPNKDMSKGEGFFNKLNRGYKNDSFTSSFEESNRDRSKNFGQLNMNSPFKQQQQPVSPGAGVGGNADGSGSMQINGESYTVQKQNSTPATNGTGSAMPNFSSGAFGRLQNAATGMGGPMMKDLMPEKKDGASFRIFGIGKLSEGQKRRRGIVDSSTKKTSKKGELIGMGSKKQKIGDLETQKIGQSAKTSAKTSAKSKKK
tara:strand:+ start:40 stop:744 length:705 start_codon:yes stop_codon:yes gene_type:complete